MSLMVAAATFALLAGALTAKIGERSLRLGWCLWLPVSTFDLADPGNTLRANAAGACAVTYRGHRRHNAP
jgi:hypothetical protein